MIKLRPLILAVFLALPLASSHAQVGISVNFAPPVLPVYAQPPCPVAGYIWTPGYWGWGAGDYYWVPGAWVPPPSVGLFWTPAWWGWNNGAYVFNQGYWGPTVGFYGGINYGYGYTGNGYWGGRWSGNTFQYNTAVTRVNRTVVRNTYVNNSFTRNVNASRASFNGPNGVNAQETAEQKAAAANAKKVGPTSQQLARQEAASKDQNLRASVNKGKPNADAVKSFNKSEGAGQGKGAQEVGAAGGPRAGQGENKLGNRQAEGAGQEKGARGPGTAEGASAGKAENNRGNIAEHNRKGAGTGGAGANGNKVRAENQGNMRTGGNHAKTNTGKIARSGGGATHEPRQMTPRSGQPKMATHGSQMGTRNAQMGGKHPQKAGGNRPQPSGGQQQQSKKKKPGER